MPKETFETVARDLAQLSGVVEWAAWSDSLSIRYSGPLRVLTQRAEKHNLFLCNIEGVFYADPMSMKNSAGEIIPADNPESASVVETADLVQMAQMIEDDGDQRLLVAIPGVEDALLSLELGGAYGWMITEAKEAQLRFTKPKHGVSYLLSRETNQLKQIAREQRNTPPGK